MAATSAEDHFVLGLAVVRTLLDLDDPTKLLGALPEPLFTPDVNERDGYVPNVAYSCGAIVHNRKLLLSYGVADTFTAFETLSVDALLKSMA